MRLKPVRASIIREIVSPTIKTGRFVLNEEEASKAVSVLPLGQPITVGCHVFVLYQDAGSYILIVRPYSPQLKHRGNVLHTDRSTSPASLTCSIYPAFTTDTADVDFTDCGPQFEGLTLHYAPSGFDDKRFSNLLARTQGEKTLHRRNYSCRGRNDLYKNVCRETVRKQLHSLHPC